MICQKKKKKNGLSRLKSYKCVFIMKICFKDDITKDTGEVHELCRHFHAQVFSQ